jgi:Ni/Co efflux regulator RcnB
MPTLHQEIPMNAMPRFRRLPAALLAALLAVPAFAAAPDAGNNAAADPDAQHAPRKAKQALDDRADPRMRSDDVGKGTHFARKPLGQGAYFDNGNREAVRKYYAAHPDKAQPATSSWQIGKSLPAGAGGRPVPAAIAGSLPKVPPGLRYLQVGSDILLVANGSRMVVDGINGVPPAR